MLHLILKDLVRTVTTTSKRFTGCYPPDDKPYIPFSDWEDLMESQPRMNLMYRDSFDDDDDDDAF